MIEVLDTLEVCQNCLIWVANGDATGMSEEEYTAVTDGEREILYRYPPEVRAYLVAGDNEHGFSWRRCECCHALAGDRYSISVLGEKKENDSQITFSF